MKEREFKCELCGGVFEKEWSDEEAKEEYERNFKEYKNEPTAIICDDCYRIVMKEKQNENK